MGRSEGVIRKCTGRAYMVFVERVSEGVRAVNGPGLGRTKMDHPWVPTRIVKPKSEYRFDPNPKRVNPVKRFGRLRP